MQCVETEPKMEKSEKKNNKLKQMNVTGRFYSNLQK